MTFIHGYLLGGLVLAGLPVLLHLLMRQKPRRLTFPAFRFLKARQRINRRKVRLQHLLLLLLRVAAIVALCLALARPRVFANRTGDGTDRAVAAVLLIDTSASMDYAVSGVTRLDDARRLAGELLDEMTDASRVALLDSGDDGALGALLPRAEARSRLDGLRLRPAAGALNLAVDRALRLLESADAEEGTPRLLYVFTDRTRAAWDTGAAAPKVPEGVAVVLVDVGVDAPRDLDIESVKVSPPVVAPGARYEIRVSLRGTPTGHENELTCTLETDPASDRAPDRRPVVLPPRETRSDVVFVQTAPSRVRSDVTHQVAVRLKSRDALAINDSRFATFLVRGSRRLLTLVEARDPRRTRVWETAHAVTRSFATEVRTFGEADRLSREELAGYSVIALFEATAVPEPWWKKLADHARAGGGVVVVPGGDEAVAGLAAFNRGGLAAGLLPAPLERLVTARDPQGLRWRRFGGDQRHPLMQPFANWRRTMDTDFDRDDLVPFVRRYWRLGRLERRSLSVADYAAPGGPALAEREVGQGKVILFTSPLDFRWVDEAKTVQWNNYWTDSSFGLILVDRACRYLGGEARTPEVNFVCGEVPRVDLPPLAGTTLTLSGPGLAVAERTLKAPAPGTPLLLPQATTPGNYLVLEGDRPVAGVSLNLPPRETTLDRIPVAEIEAALGSGAVVRPGQGASLRDALAAARPAPVELLPALMMALLVVLTLDSFLANRFYKRPTAEAPPARLREDTAALSAKGAP